MAPIRKTKTDKTLEFKREDAETLAVIESTLECIKNDLKEIVTKLDTKVSEDDPGYFDKHMKNHKKDDLHTKANWFNIIDLIFKVSLAGGATTLAIDALSHMGG